jgi:hypothetical protein
VCGMRGRHAVVEAPHVIRELLWLVVTGWMASCRQRDQSHSEPEASRQPPIIEYAGNHRRLLCESDGAVACRRSGSRVIRQTTPVRGNGRGAGPVAVETIAIAPTSTT